MELFLLLLQIPFLIFLIKYLRKKHSDPLFVNSYYYVLSLKVTAGLFLGILYFNYYKEGDTVIYLQDFDLLNRLFYSKIEDYISVVVYDKIPEGATYRLLTFDQDRAFAFVRILSPFYILSGSNYWLLSIYLSIFSFAGFWILSNTMIQLFKLNSLAVLISFFLFPTVVFWSSGVLKECLVMGAMCFTISILLNLAHQKSKFSIVKFILLLLFSWILFYVKFYYFAVLFAVLMPYVLVRFASLKIPLLQNKRYRIGLFLLAILLFSLAASFSHPILNLNTISASIYRNYKVTHLTSNVSNVFDFPGLSREASSFIPHIPKALVYGLFSPFLWQCKKIISLISGIENTFLLILFTTFILSNFKKDKLRNIDIEEISIVLYVSILAIFMAFASPNWGSLVRYKVGYLPFFILLILNKNPFIQLLEDKVKFFKRSDKKE